MHTKETRWVWLDLEMTGLDVEANVIIEIATIVTDTRLNIVAKGPNIAISQPQSVLDAMDEWNTAHHYASGLVERVQTSNISTVEAESTTLAFLEQYLDQGQSPLCGNSVGQDRRFLMRYMPRLAAFFHYRNLDVSTLKILFQQWAPAVAAGFTKVSQHLAEADILDSIEELRYYQAHMSVLEQIAVE